MGPRVIQSQDVLGQSDYRSILRLHYRARKARKKGFSYSVWARELGISSPSTLIMVLNGQRHPGRGLVQKLSRNLGLSGVEDGFFRDLITLQKIQTKNVGAAVLLLEKLRKKRGDASFEFVDYGTFESIANWHYAAIREMVHLQDFREDELWICNKLAFKITPKQVREAIQTLLRLRLLKRGRDRRLAPSIAHTGTGQDVRNLAIQQFHEQSLANASAALKKFPPEDREFHSTTFAMPAASLAEAKQWIRKMHDEFCDRFEKTPADRLVQFQICLYPLTRGKV